jgi:pimeloyl-ACP methyl ester carboxylesterase
MVLMALPPSCALTCLRLSCRVSCSYHDTAVSDPASQSAAAAQHRAATAQQSAPSPSVHSIRAGEHGPHMVCLPGYGAGAAFFYRNLQGLSQHAQVHLVDPLGTGLSARPDFTCRNRADTERWFIDSLEGWRKAQGLERMVLVGHSLGGYLSTAYALQHPERVQHLILVCPAGVVRSALSLHPSLHAPLRAPGAQRCGAGRAARMFGAADAPSASALHVAVGQRPVRHGHAGAHERRQAATMPHA